MPICVYVNTNTPITGNLITLFGAHVGHAAMGFENLESIAGVSDFSSAGIQREAVPRMCTN